MQTSLQHFLQQRLLQVTAAGIEHFKQGGYSFFASFCLIKSIRLRSFFLICRFDRPVESDIFWISAFLCFLYSEISTTLSAAF